MKTTEVSKPLNSLERTTLRNAEATIKTHMASFVEVGASLMAIRDQQLYRETHKTFEAYVKGKWDFTRDYAYKLIAARDVVENVDHGIQKPTSERQARPLTELPAEEQPKAWKEAVRRAEEAGKPVTAAIVEEVVEEMKGDTVVFRPSPNGKTSGASVPVSPSDQAKVQIKIWYDTISRWLGQPVSIDDVRKLAPGKQGDNAVALASTFYEALKIWHSSIK